MTCNVLTSRMNVGSLVHAVDKMEEMIGSYGPRAEPYEKTFASSEAPSGLLARGNYSVRSRVVDDDGNVFADWEWAFKVSSGANGESMDRGVQLLTR